MNMQDPALPIILYFSTASTFDKIMLMLPKLSECKGPNFNVFPLHVFLEAPNF